MFFSVVLSSIKRNSGIYVSFFLIDSVWNTFYPTIMTEKPKSTIKSGSSLHLYSLSSCPHGGFPDFTLVLVLAVCFFSFAGVSEHLLMLPLLQVARVWSLPVAGAACCSLSCKMSLSKEASRFRLSTIWPSLALRAPRTSSNTPCTERQAQSKSEWERYWLFYLCKHNSSCLPLCLVAHPQEHPL